MSLNDTKIRNARPGEGVIKLSDGGGLQLWIMPTGGKLWRLAYRFQGSQKKLSIGPYPAVSLATARTRREEARTHLAAGRDPSAEKKVEKARQIASHAATFGAIAEELVAKKAREGKAAATIDKTEWLLRLVSDQLHARPIQDVSASEILAALRIVEAKGRLESAKRLRATIGQVFRYAVATGRVSADPTFALRGALTAPSVKHRPAITEPKAFGGLLRAVEGYQGQLTVRAALKLLALLFPRPGELRQAEWTEFDFERSVWTIPASRTKMRREHVVPLPRQALEILQALRPLTERTGLLFPGHGMSGGHARRVGPKPLSENTLNGALRRLGYGSEDMTSHGFRATASSLLNESGKFSADAIERALAHQDRDAVRRAYARGEFMSERACLMQWWADECDRMRESGKVLRLQAG